MDALIKTFIEHFSKYKDVKEDEIMKKLEADIKTFLRELNILCGKVDPTAPTLSWVVCIDKFRHLNIVFEGCTWSFLTHLKLARLIPIGSVFRFIKFA